MTPAELIQLDEQIIYWHRRRSKDATGRGAAPPLRSGQTTVERLADNGRNRCTTLLRERPNPLVALVVDKNLQPVREHTHTLACAYVWIGLRCWAAGVLRRSCAQLGPSAKVARPGTLHGNPR